MTRKLGLTAFNATLAGVMTLFVVGCDQAGTAPTPPAPSTTVGTQIDDSVVTTRVKTALLEDQDVKSFDLKVETRKGEVMLSGLVDNTFQRDRAVLVARSVPGVVAVDNQVGLKGGATTFGTKVDDGIITTQIKASLLADASVKSLDIMVVTRDNNVQLSGFVNSQDQIDRALSLAHSIEGVKNVENNMSIKK
jgi:hyperosmotically inducible protein